MITVTSAIALAGGISATCIPWVLYRQAAKKDEVARRSGLVTQSSASTLADFQRLYTFIDNLQEDNTSFREDLRTCAQRCEAIATRSEVRIDAITKERDEAIQKLNHMYRKYGNGDTPPGGTPKIG